MSYDSGMRDDIVTVLNRKAEQVTDLGIDAYGVEWEEVMCLHASVTWAKGVSALNVGAPDAYKHILVRMNWNNVVTMRSRIRFEDHLYAIQPETFHPDYRENTLQFTAQLIINED